MIATEELPESLVRSVSPKLRAHGGTERLVAYYRPSPDGKRILFGGRAFGKGDQPQLYSKYLQDFMIRTFPQLQETKIDYAWSGLCGLPPLTMCRTLAKWTICITPWAIVDQA